MAKVKVLDMNDTMHITCIKNTEKTCINPYRLYLNYNATDKYGYPATHRKQLAAYGDFNSIMCHINDMYKAGINRMPIEYIIAWNKKYYNPY